MGPWGWDVAYKHGGNKGFVCVRLGIGSLMEKGDFMLEHPPKRVAMKEEKKRKRHSEEMKWD